jgi:hypothetical protein
MGGLTLSRGGRQVGPEPPVVDVDSSIQDYLYEEITRFLGYDGVIFLFHPNLRSKVVHRTTGRYRSSFTSVL